MKFAEFLILRRSSVSCRLASDVLSCPFVTPLSIVMLHCMPAGVPLSSTHLQVPVTHVRSPVVAARINISIYLLETHVRTYALTVRTWALVCAYAGLRARRYTEFYRRTEDPTYSGDSDALFLICWRGFTSYAYVRSSFISCFRNGFINLGPDTLYLGVVLSLCGLSALLYGCLPPLRYVYRRFTHISALWMSRSRSEEHPSRSSTKRTGISREVRGRV